MRNRRLAPSFTILECVIALVVTGIVIAIISMTLPSAQRASHRTLNNPLDFELCLAELEGDDHQFRLVEVEPHSCRLLDTKTNKHFKLLCRGRIYLTAVGGYMELLDDVKTNSLNCHQLDQSRVAISVVRKDGAIQQAIVRFKPQQLEDKHHGKAKETVSQENSRLRATISDRDTNDLDGTNRSSR